MELSKKQKTAILIIICGIACVLFGSMVLSFFRTDHSDEDSPSATLEVPDAMIDEVEESKIEAYRKNDIRNVDRYWDASSSEDPIDEILSEVTDSQAIHTSDRKDDKVMPKHITIEELQDQAKGQGQQNNSSGTTSSSGRRSSSVSSSSSSPSGNSGVTDSSVKTETGAERLARYERERAEVIAQAQQKSNGISQSSGNEVQAEQNVTPEKPKEQQVIGEEASVKKSGIISSLDDYSGSVISSLDDIEETVSQDENYPFQCMFVRLTRIKSGDRVAVRLLEDMVVNGILVQKNTHLMAYCTIDDRVKLEISNIEVNGKLYKMNYEAYDTDGALGIYCPDLVNNTGKQIKGTGANIINRLIGTRVNSTARELVTTGVSIATGEGAPSVTVPAGYTFFIVKKKNE